MGIENAPARRVGVAFARPLKGRISKCHDKRADGINVPVLGIDAAVDEGKCFEKLRSNFYLLWGVTGAKAPVEGGSEKAVGFVAWGETSPKKYKLRISINLAYGAFALFYFLLLKDSTLKEIAKRMFKDDYIVDKMWI
jgi:hypothetical protein